MGKFKLSLLTLIMLKARNRADNWKRNLNLFKRRQCTNQYGGWRYLPFKLFRQPANKHGESIAVSFVWLGQMERKTKKMLCFLTDYNLSFLTFIPLFHIHSIIQSEVLLVLIMANKY